MCMVFPINFGKLKRKFYLTWFNLELYFLWTEEYVRVTHNLERNKASPPLSFL